MFSEFYSMTVAKVVMNAIMLTMLAVFYCYTVTLTGKDRRLYRAGCTALVVLLSFCISLLLYSHVVLKLVCNILFEIAGLWLISRAPILKTVLFALLGKLIMVLSEVFTAVLSSLFVPSSTTVMIQDGTSELYLFVLSLAFIVLYGGAALFFGYRNRSIEYSVTDLLRLLLLPLSQLVIMLSYYMSVQIYLEPEALSRMLPLVMMLLCIVVDISLFTFFRKAIRQRQRESYYQLQLNYYKTVTEQSQALRRLRHDLANHLTVMQELVQKNSPEAPAYVDGLMEYYRSATAHSYCGDDIVNAVLQAKASTAEQLGLRYTVSAQMGKAEGIEPPELMSLLANLLDNALEAATGTEDGFVDVSLQQRPENLIIQVRNSVRPELQVDTRRTSKRENAENHGLGMGIIRSIAARYGGSCQTAQTENVFSVTVLLSTKA